MNAPLLAAALDPARILEAQGLTPDPWQRDLLLAREPRVLLNCSRGAGKSRTCSALALHTALFRPGSLVLLLSRALRQALELLRYVKQGWRALGRPLAAPRLAESQIELANGSRVVSLPGREDTIRSFQGVALLIIDEAARVPDDLYYSVRPMLNVSRGRLVCLSTAIPVGTKARVPGVPAPGPASCPSAVRLDPEPRPPPLAGGRGRRCRVPQRYPSLGGRQSARATLHRPGAEGVLRYHLG
jgi:Terminase large subunit, T4likevirus-type, N-terminal